MSVCTFVCMFFYMKIGQVIIIRLFSFHLNFGSLKENSKVCFCISKTNLPMVDYTAKSRASSH